MDLKEIGQTHAILIHFPFLLFSAALIADMLNYFGVKGALKVGHWLVILGLLSCIPTLFTGLIAAESFEPGNELVAHHRFLGFTGGVSASLYAGLRISIMVWKIELKSVYYLILSVLLVLLFLNVMNSGEKIRELPIKSHDPVAE